MADPSGNGWTEYRKFVVEALDHNRGQLHGIERRLRNMERDIVMLKTKIYIASASIGLVVSVTISLIVNWK
jgi:hypothetical protein